MSTKKKILIIVIAVALISVILYFILRKKDIPTDTNTPPITPPDTKSPFKENSFPLDLNMKGDYVLALQRALNRLKPTNPIKEDGVFGFSTKTKLLLTVPVTQSKLPMPSATWMDIIKQSNNLK